MEQGSVFRQKKNKKHQKQSVSIPLEQGSVFRRRGGSDESYQCSVSIPLEQGSVFRQMMITEEEKLSVSIPLEQGSVFRLQWYFEALWHKAYESHFPTFSET